MDSYDFDLNQEPFKATQHGVLTSAMSPACKRRSHSKHSPVHLVGYVALGNPCLIQALM